MANRMDSKKALALSLSELDPIQTPQAELEQYPTPPQIAATMVHLADLHDDLENPVVDLGTGTGIIAIGAALRDPPRVVAVELDRQALQTGRRNESRVSAPRLIDWLQADATALPLCLTGATVLMNPPFGAQRANRHADRRFLESAIEIAAVSYSLHNAGSREFIESFASDHGGQITHGFETQFQINRQFDFHTHDAISETVELYRIEWP